MIRRICLIHSNSGEAKEKAALLAAQGFQPEVLVPGGQSFRKALRAHPPAAIVISLDRLPSQGRDIALALRLNKSTRMVPLLFAGGVPAKVAQVKETLPDAAYAEWGHIGEALRRTIAAAPDHPVVPRSVLAAYHGSPLGKKLGLRPDSVVALIDAPDGFDDQLLSFEPGVQFEDRPQPNCTLVFWFVRSDVELDRNVDVMARYAGKASLWILWPRGTPGLSPQRLRTAAMAQGLVDYKICSVDKTWSGMLFTRRKPSLQGG